MAVCDYNVKSTAVLKVSKQYSKAQRGSAHITQACLEGHVRKRPIPVVAIEVRGVVREIGLDQIHRRIRVIVSEIYTHASLFPAIRTGSDACLHSDFLEAPGATRRGDV